MTYVVIQFSCIIFLLVNARVDHFELMSLGLLAISAIVGISAIIHMTPKNLNIMPTLKQQHKLITHGIYAYIRHPMYTSVILLCLSLMLSNNILITQIVILVLIADLILKSTLEEKLLSKRFEEYAQYKQKTWRFIPFL